MKTLNSITQAINSQIKASASQAFVIGENLELAKAHFIKKNGSTDGKAFIAWVEETFGIKKAQTYNYITISKVFSDKKGFESVGIKVLTQIMRDATLLKEAEEAMKDGACIDASWVKAHSRKKQADSVKEEGKEWDVDNEAELKKEIKRLKSVNKDLITLLREEREVAVKLAEEVLRLREQLEGKSDSVDKVKEAFNTLDSLKAEFNKAPKDLGGEVYNKRGKVKASFRSRAHPDKVSHLNDSGLTKAYTEFFQSL